MEPIQIGQRVRVIDGRLIHYRQVGTVVAVSAQEGYYVHLDYDDDRPEAQIFFHAEELEPAPGVPPRSPRAAHWSANAGLDRRPPADMQAHPPAATPSISVSTPQDQVEQLAEPADQEAP